VKFWCKSISTDVKLDIISRFEKCKGIVHICRNVRVSHNNVNTIRDNADRIKEIANTETKVFVCVAGLPQSYQDEPYEKACVSYIFTALEINK
jgi:hypothetical protein